MTDWNKSVRKLPDDHEWKAKPGNNVFVGDAGAIRFDIPQDWIVEPAADAIVFHDRQPPDDDCRMQVTIFRLPPGLDLTELPLLQLFEQTVLKEEPDGRTNSGKVKQIQRPNLELAWVESRFIDPGENREACSRACLARGNDIHALITLDFWPEHRRRFAPVWTEVLRSLRLGEYVSGYAGRRLYRG